MVAAQVGFGASFVAGLFSFLSPCVLPLVPAYLSIVTGATLHDLEAGAPSPRRTLLPCLLFVLGFSAVFILMGASASAAGRFLLEYRRPLNVVFGTVVVIMGLVTAGVVKIQTLYREKRFHPRRDLLSPMGPLAFAITGAAFALGWTPCVGPILSSILLMAAASQSVYSGMALLTFYSLGLGIPFIVAGLFFNRAISFLGWFKRNQRKANAGAGALLVAMGIILILDSYGWLLTFL